MTAAFKNALVALAFASAFGAANASAQVGAFDRVLGRAQANAARVEQSSETNGASIRQLNRGNSAGVTQNGDDNAAAVRQNGVNNAAGLIQNGNSNTLTVTQNNANNAVCYVQRGNNLTGNYVQNGGERAIVLQSGRRIRVIPSPVAPPCSIFR